MSHTTIINGFRYYVSANKALKILKFAFEWKQHMTSQLNLLYNIAKAIIDFFKSHRQHIIYLDSKICNLFIQLTVVIYNFPFTYLPNKK